MKKGTAPAHLQKSIFVHPAANSALITILEKLPDPRGVSPNFSYSLTSILLIVTITMLCGAEDWEEMSALAEGMQEWLSHYRELCYTQETRFCHLARFLRFLYRLCGVHKNRFSEIEIF